MTPGSRRILSGLVLYAAMALFAVWHIQQVERPRVPALGAWAAFAALPALIAIWPGRAGAPRRFAIALVPYTIVAVGLATGHWPFRPHLLGHTGYFARVAGDIHTGLNSWLITVLPYDAVRTPEVRVVVLLAAALLFAALAAAIFVWEAPMPAIVLAFVPFLVASTVFRLGSPVERAAVMLALALAALAILGGQGSGVVQAGVAALIVGLATAAVGVPGVAKAAFVDWRHIGQVPKGTTMAFIWNQTYGPLIRPAHPVSLLRVAASRPSYWRVTVLDVFDGRDWVEAATVGKAVSPPDVTIPSDRLSPDTLERRRTNRLSARLTNIGWQTQALAEPPVTIALHGVASQVGGVTITPYGTVQVEHPPPVGSSWSVDYVPPRPTISDLVDQGATYPDAVASADLQLTLQHIQFPAWGSPDRDARVQELLDQNFFDDTLSGWKDVYAQARHITRKAQSPYEAAAAIEKFFHDTYRYDEKADYSHSAAPLPDFFQSATKAGYCQMFSGTMAVMLRMLGIPARVAEGFTVGRRAPGASSYLVTDRDAHAWVEVYIPRYGWLPFEPTPTRSLPYSYSTTSPDLSKALAAETKQSQGNTRLTDLENRLGIAKSVGGPAPHNTGGARGLREGASPPGPPPAKRWHPGFATYLIGVVIVVLLLIVVTKFLRSLRVYVGRTPEAIAASVRADLEAYVRDQGVAGSVRALTPTEFGRMLRREFGVDAHRWADVQSRARYGPPDGRAYEMARQARREARDVKRQLRKGLAPGERLRGAVRLRSLLP